MSKHIEQHVITEVRELIRIFGSAEVLDVKLELGRQRPRLLLFIAVEKAPMDSYYEDVEILMVANGSDIIHGYDEYPYYFSTVLDVPTDAYKENSSFHGTRTLHFFQLTKNTALETGTLLDAT